MRPLSELISDHVVPWEQLPWPLDIAAIFERQAPLVVEIGFGDGAFLEAMVRNDPDRNFLGVELAWDPMQWCFKRLDRLTTRNVRLIRADAAHVLERLLPAQSVSEFVVNHPDPWPKDRHHGRRLVQPRFLELVSECLAPSGRITIATDHADYADWIAERLESQSRLVPELSATRVAELPGRLVTRYQRKAREAGIGNHFFVWTNGHHPARPRKPEEPGTMPNVTFRGPADASVLLRGFESQNRRELVDGVEIILNFVRAWQLPDEPRWMVETVVKDGRFSQQI
ncbi:MAG: tRNA (guanosine(46)-N7)-methyltransferase TrmB, partial [Planctomycetes bacterium]|nr:tRNA (guanosine(46)-N7)-methyltransferase TrmB [Planctomycetota bacterium]